jgi:hypothetical protein
MESMSFSLYANDSSNIFILKVPSFPAILLPSEWRVPIALRQQSCRRILAKALMTK